MNKILEDYKKYMESINPIMQYERLKVAHEKDKEFIGKVQDAFNKWIIQHGTTGYIGKGNYGGNGNKI